VLLYALEVPEFNSPVVWRVFHEVPSLNHQAVLNGE
jgi:hypothetical protein